MELVGEWNAIEDHMPPEPPTIRVTGTCRFPTGGWTAELREREGSPPFNPRMLMLELVVTPPPGGSAQTQAVDDVPVEYTAEVVAGPECQYSEVDIAVIVNVEGKTLRVDCVS